MKIYGGDISGSLTITGSLIVSGSISGGTYSGQAVTALTASSADNFIVRNNLTGSNALFTGGITAQTLTVQMVTSSIVYSSGSNTFGNQLTDVQQMTGSLRVTGSGVNYIVGGNVGIGTTTPFWKLDVSGNGRFTSDMTALNQVLTNTNSEGLRVYNSSGASLTEDAAVNSDSSYVYFTNFLKTRGLQIRQTTGNLNLIGGNVGVANANPTAKLHISGSTNSETLFRVQSNTGTEGLFVSSSGKVGIGTTTPSNKLDVNGGTAGAATFRNAYNFAGDNYTIRIVGDATKYGYISQYVNSGNLVLASGMRYYGAGPYTPDSTTAESIQLYNGDIYFTTNAGLTAGVNFTPSTRMFISSSGNVGIGITNPLLRCHIFGSTSAFPSASGTTQTGGVLRLQNSDSNGILDIGGNGGNGFWLQTTDATTLAANYSLLLNPNGGNVGIGNTNPTYTLDVEAASSILRLNSKTNSNNSIFLLSGKNSLGNSKTSAISFLPDSEKLVFSADGFITNMVITAAGDAGIGTTTPSKKLDVNGDANISGSITTNGFILKGDPADTNYNTRTRIIQDTFTISNAAAVNFDVDTLVSNALFTIEVSAMSYTGGTSYWEHGIGRGYLFPSGFGISYTSLSNSGLSVALSYQNSSTVRVALTDTVSATSKSAVIRITITAGYI